MVLYVCSKLFQASDSGKKFETALEKVCDLCPEVQEPAEPMFRYVGSGDMDKMMEEGVASMESVRSSRAAVMDLMAMMVYCLVSYPFYHTGLSISRPLGKRLKL